MNREDIIQETLRLHDLKYGNAHCDRKYVTVCSQFQSLLFEAGQNVRINELHGKGAAEAIEAAYADGSIFDNRNEDEEPKAVPHPMIDVQARVSAIIHNESDLHLWQAERVAAALAEADLLADMTEALRHMTDARDALGDAWTEALAERDAARAELAEVNQRAIEMEGRYRGAKLRAETAERRGAVAALREASAAWGRERDTNLLTTDKWLRARADRIEGDAASNPCKFGSWEHDGTHIGERFCFTHHRHSCEGEDRG